MKIKLSADSRQAQKSLHATANAAENAADEVKEYNEASAEGSSLERVLNQQKEAFEAEAEAIREANRALREREKLEKDMDRLQDMRSKNSLGSQLAEAGRAALAAAPAAAAAGMGALMAESSQRAAAWEQGTARLRVSAGDSFPEVRNAVEDLSSQYGTAATALLGQADRLMRAGMTSEQAVKAMESAVVAAAGDTGKMEGILDSLAEAASRGYLEEDLLGKLDEVGISFRTTLQEHLGMTKDELDSALSAGKIDVSSYFSVIDQLTGKGSDAQKAAEEALKTTGGMMQKMSSEWDSMLRNFGQLINEGLVAPIAGKLLPLMEKAAGWWNDLMLDKTEDLVADTPSSYQKFAQEHGYAEAQRPQEQLEAQKKLTEEIARRTEKFKELKFAMRAAANAEAWASMDLGKKRDLIGRNTGLGSGVTVQQLEKKLRDHPVFAKLAAGESISAEDEQNFDMLNRQLGHLKTLEQQEEAARRQEESLTRQKEESAELLRNAERRYEIMQAELAGDKDRVALLKTQEEMERRQADYQKMGLSEEEAQQRAARDLAAQNQLAAAKQQRQTSTQEAPKVTGLTQTSLASVGGGGVSIRNYENQALKSAQKTEQNTANIYTAVDQILNAVRQPRTTSAVIS